MELDRALWRAVEDGACHDVLLRLYRWAPPAVSLGFHQPAVGLDPDAARAMGVDVVRRPSGGAAVLHWNEWTYAVAGPLRVPGLGGRISEIYAAVGASLVAALQAIGVAAQLAGSGRPAGMACFAALGGHEIQVGGRKLVGSALRRGRHAFLQHGSILRGPEHARLAELLRPGDSSPAAIELLARERAALEAHTTDLVRLRCDVERGEELAQPFAAALARLVGIPAVRVVDFGELPGLRPLRT